jgi:hypothetical protein
MIPFTSKQCKFIIFPKYTTIYSNYQINLSNAWFYEMFTTLVTLLAKKGGLYNAKFGGL